MSQASFESFGDTCITTAPNELCIRLMTAGTQTQHCFYLCYTGFFCNTYIPPHATDIRLVTKSDNSAVNFVSSLFSHAVAFHYYFFSWCSCSIFCSISYAIVLFFVNARYRSISSSPVYFYAYYQSIVIFFLSPLFYCPVHFISFIFPSIYICVLNFFTGFFFPPI